MIRRPLWNCTFKFSSIIAAALLTTCCLARTNHIREFAKNKPRIYIVTSGAQATEVAHLLQNAILRNMDNKHTIDDVPILTLPEAEKMASGNTDFAKSPVVFLLTGKDLDSPLPAKLVSFLPFEISNPAQKISIIASVLAAGKNGQVFNVGLFAPDSERLRKLYDVFIARDAENYRALPFEQKFVTNKLALFSAPEDQRTAEQWGKMTGSNVWNDTQWFAVGSRDQLTPDQISGRTRVYFLNRSDHTSPPAEAATLLEPHLLKPTTILIGKQEKPGDGDGGVVVFSAPSRTILWSKAERRYPNVDLIPAEPVSQEAIDLRTVTKTTLLMSGGSGEQERERVRSLLAADLRKAGFRIEDRGPGLQVLQREVTLEQLEGANDTAKALRRKAGLRYVFHFALIDYNGTTEYEPGEKKVTPDFPAYSESEPSEPSPDRPGFRGKKPQAEYDKQMAEWRPLHTAWEERKKEYDDKVENSEYHWERWIEGRSSGHVRGFLRLIDMRDGSGGNTIWEHECDGSEPGTAMVKRDSVNVRGPETHPSSLDAPASRNECAPDLLNKAVHNASTQALLDLQETTLMPQAQGYGIKDAEPPALRETDSPQSTSACVADVQDGVVTLNIGAADGVRVGDRVVIPTKTKEISDPVTGKVIDMRVLDSIVLRVKEAGPAADCVPASALDTAKLKLVHRGMTIRWGHPSAPAPAHRASVHH